MDKQANIEKWKGIVLEIIQYIQKDKEDRNISPTHATDIEILELVRKRVKSITNMLVKDGELIEGETMNNKYYKCKTK